MNFKFTIPDYKKIRVIIDTDAACEADDPFAIVQALLSPKLIVKGIIATHFAAPGSMEKSFSEVETILNLMNLDVPHFKGQKDAADKELSEGAKFIIEEANRESDNPLFLLCQGAITNVSAALKAAPTIADKIKIIWIGTHGKAPHPAQTREYNAGNDVDAANFVLQSKAEIWLVPSTVYSTITIGIAEIQRRISPCGKIGGHLFTNLVNYNNSECAGWTKGESWTLGDSPAIALALNPDAGHFITARAPHIAGDTSSEVCETNPIVRIYTDVDSRYILEDLIAKLEIFAEQD